ncbi:hypothetical protein KBY58_07050 [Cyanobium sp. HWJ4-Hawea]|uniref:bluetail domain-containing putative surface protein n=1 Tax=Cyanobium sp. HWJ4-Hawea TaxID=2823713 RepID=UPI0020CEFAD1|nr:bluetail domain-containing putative surface protein [Cyanobium sp. HWJ4-Hawea]MCP9809188.1 hypothetical protein [Cyanobium sp. HWJ4-Hawea]
MPPANSAKRPPIVAPLIGAAPAPAPAPAPSPAPAPAPRPLPLNLLGGAGNDVLVGDNSSNNYSGGDGNDRFLATAGSDSISGGAGIDTLDYSGLNADITLSRGGVISKSGGLGTDTIASFDVEVIQANPNRRNVIDGSTGTTATMTVDLSKESLTINNLPFVGSASLVVKGFQDVVGSENADTITGSNFANNLNGGGGNDLLRGLGGGDILTGGAGSDTFAYGMGDSLLSGFDRITDLVIGTDVIDGWSAVGKVSQLGRVASLDLAEVGNLLNGRNFSANDAVTFSLGAGSNNRTFLALNDGQAGFQGGSDGIIEITGFSGDLSRLTVV